jgi:hypothetical protein
LELTHAAPLDESWLLNVQQKLYARSRNNPGYVFRKLWGFVTDARNLSEFLEQECHGNRGVWEKMSVKGKETLH